MNGRHVDHFAEDLLKAPAEGSTHAHLPVVEQAPGNQRAGTAPHQDHQDQHNQQVDICLHRIEQNMNMNADPRAKVPGVAVRCAV